MKKIKEEKGAISILVILTMLFFVSFLVVTYIFVSNKAEIQMEATRQVKDMYEKDANEIYNSYFANNEAETNVTIPIYTVEQLLKIGSNEYIQIKEVGGKYYYFSPLATYILMNNLEFESDEWNIDELKSANFDWNGNTITFNEEEFPIDYTYIIENLREREVLGETDTLSEETLNKIYVAQKETGLSTNCFTVAIRNIDGVATEYVAYLYGGVYKETYVIDENGVGDGVASYNARAEMISRLNNLTDGMFAGDINENGKLDEEDLYYMGIIVGSYSYTFSPYIENGTDWLDCYYTIISDVNQDQEITAVDKIYINRNLEAAEDFVVIYKYDYMEDFWAEMLLQEFNY
ncbi:MAG: hypothetical protein IJN50_00520 [Clostridia bacterium]|nr:hypothetical protein [Clostridia bacterium]